MAIRKIQKGTLRVGPFKYDVSLMTATDSNGGLKFKNVHRKDSSAVKTKKICSTCNKELKTTDIMKEYTFEDGFSMEVTDADFADAFGSPDRNMKIKKFVPLEHVNPLLIEKGYYIVPNKYDDQEYFNFVKAVHDNMVGGFTSLFFHGSEHLGMIRALDEKTLIVQQIEYPENLRIPAEVKSTANYDEGAVEIMKIFLSNMTDNTSDLREFKDTFSRRMKRVLNKKRKALIP